MAAQLISLTLVAISTVVLGQNSVEWLHNDLLDGMKCTNALFEEPSRSDISCAARCGMDNECKSVFITQEHVQKCFGCDSIFTASDLGLLDDEPGTSYYSPNGPVCAANCEEVGGVCTDNTCQCPKGFFLNETDNMCRSRMMLEPGDRRGNGINTGLIRMYVNNNWYYLEPNSWNWRASMAACIAINPSLKYGGSPHAGSVFNTSSRVSVVRTGGISCPPDDLQVSFYDCSFALNTPPDGLPFGITCFTENITDNARLNPAYTQGGTDTPHRLELKYDGTWGTVCRRKFNANHGDIYCKSVDPSKSLLNSSCTDSCAGGPPGPYIVNNIDCKGSEPNIFFCKNGGWGTDIHSCPNQEVGLLCTPEE